MTFDIEDYLEHYGTPRRSGRYPWGSGDNDTATRNQSFLDQVDELTRKGLSATQVAAGMGITTTELRARKSIAKNEEKQAKIARAERLSDAGNSNSAIARLMGVNESSVRSLLAPGAKERSEMLLATSNMLKEQVDKKIYLDIGSGVENHIGVSATRLGVAVAVLKEQGYQVHTSKIETTIGNKTTLKVLTPPGVTSTDVFMNRDKIQHIAEYSTDNGRTFFGMKPPISMDSSRLQVKYAEEGGTKADGVMYIRPGAEGLSLGASRYAQVRIAVDGTHYIKGMAMYKDDLPDGVDIQFNTNKSDKGDKLSALKPMNRTPDGKVDLENPFGAAIKPGGQKGHVNIVNEEGDWDTWSKNLSTQMLSKQKPALAKQQLDETYRRKAEEFDEIMGLTNPKVRQHLLDAYADSTDSSAVHMKAAALKGQSSHVILPLNAMKETEVYAPNFQNGDRVVLIRYPHGGKFEIPELVVNNNQPTAKRILGKATDAIGINHKVAERLSGADFDGDTVLVIPNNKRQISTAPALEGLKNFDPQSRYPSYDGMPKMSSRTKGIQMGQVSNLITDMTIKGASSDELARAVRHSMVVIDAEKHNLNYRQSAKDNGISALKAKYQDGANKGASTLISRASSDVRVEKRKARPAGDGGPVDKKTGELKFVPTGEGYTRTTVNKKTGVETSKWIPKTELSTKLAEAKDAHSLVSDNGGTHIERLYADHSNRLKALANEARKQSVNTKTTPYSPEAKAAHPQEVASLNGKLNTALKNRPLERQAQILAATKVAARIKANPDMDAAEVKKLKGMALAQARAITGAKKDPIVLAQSEWSAIQAGAISNYKLEQILRNADLDRVKELATPKVKPVWKAGMKAKALRLAASGATQAEIADALGVSLTTLKTELK